MKSREERFYGTGNHTLIEGGRPRRVWRVYCSSCNAEGFVGSGKGILPPHVVLKKFRQKGWLIAVTEFRDICPACKSPAFVPKPVAVTPAEPPEPPPATPGHTPPTPADDAALLEIAFKEIEELKETIVKLDRELIRRRDDDAALNDLWRFNRHIEELERENDKLRKELSDRLKYTQGDPSEFVRNVHSLLLASETDLVRKKIEQTYPKWPWPQPAIKKTGSIKRPKVPDDAGFDEWINREQAQRVLHTRNGGDKKTNEGMKTSRS